MPPAATAPARDALHADLPAEVQKLVALGVQRRYRRQTVLIEEGDRGDLVYIVISGRLRAYVSDARGREVTLGLHGPGEYVGEMSLDGGVRSASVQAIEPTLCAVVTRDTLLRHIATDPQFAMGLIVRLIRRARLATESARSMALLDVYSRLKRLLEERAVTQPDETRVIEKRLTHQAMASELGCSREMVSRLMKDLENGRYIERVGFTVHLLNPLPVRW